IDNLQLDIQKTLIHPIVLSSAMANDTFLIDWIPNNLPNQPAKMQEYLRNVTEKFNLKSAFFISDKTKHYYRENGVLGTLSDTNPEDEWYFKLKQSTRPYLIDIGPDTMKDGTINIFVDHKVIDRNGNIIGAIGVGVSLDSVIKTIEQHEKESGRRIYFINQDGEIALKSKHHQKINNNRSQLAPYQKALSNEQARFSIKTNNRIFDVSTIKLDELNWHLIIEKDDTYTLFSVWESLSRNVILSILLGYLMLIVAYTLWKKYQTELERMATHDALTGCISRYALYQYFQQIPNKKKERTPSNSVLLIDIDYFKLINDQYGHLVGDQVLIEFTKTINTLLRPNDVLCRWGGEEFLLVLSACDLDSAITIAKNVIRTIRHNVYQIDKHCINITVSIGIARHRDGESVTQLIKRCDTLLYSAKHNGRDGYVSEETSLTPPPEHTS
ncbi:MAG: sensor domain-containing diguanylate cyclase, partial [Pseudomonadota bacterium]